MAAIELFAEHGFHGATLADIAERADIAPRTFFSYFPSKEAAVFGNFEPAFASLAERLAHRGDEGAVDTMRAWILDLLDEIGVADEQSLKRRAVIDASSELQAYERHLTARFEQLLAEALAQDLGRPVDDLQPRLVAAAAAATLSVLRPDPAADGSHSGVMEQLDQAMAFLRGGLAALSETSKPVRE